MIRQLVTLFMVAVAASAFALKKDPAYRNARRSGAWAKIQIHVVDDLGQNVPNAFLCLSTLHVRTRTL